MGLGWNISGPCLLCVGQLRVKSKISRKGQSQEGQGMDCSVPQREVAGGPYYVTHPTVKTGDLTTDQRGCVHGCAMHSQLCLCASCWPDHWSRVFTAGFPVHSTVLTQWGLYVG